MSICHYLEPIQCLSIFLVSPIAHDLAAKPPSAEISLFTSALELYNAAPSTSPHAEPTFATLSTLARLSGKAGQGVHDSRSERPRTTGSRKSRSSRKTESSGKLNYSEEEITALLDLTQEIEPFGNNIWLRVTEKQNSWEGHTSRPIHELEYLKTKFDKLQTKNLRVTHNAHQQSDEQKNWTGDYRES